MQYQKIAITLIASIGLSANVYGKDRIPNELTEAFKNGSTSVDLRLRYEDSRQQPLEDGKATTLRSAIGYETDEFIHSRIKLELVDVANMFGQRYNPGVSDISKPNYTTIADPRGAGLTEAKLIFNGIEKNSITVGRQYIQLDNERFIGKNDFRQFPQSFDALTITNTMINGINLRYSLATHFNSNFANGRTPGGRHSLRTHLANIDWNGYQYGNISGYAYFNKDKTVRSNSHTIIGFRVVGTEEQTGSVGYTLELARQQGKFGNPKKYAAQYLHAEANKTIEMLKAKVGVERLGGHSTEKGKAFITPLGSINNFNGMAEVFAITPDRGLQDYYLGLEASHADLSLFATYHYFRLDKGPSSKRIGQELDLGVEFKFNDNVILNAGYAKFNPKGNKAPRTRRVWAMLSAKLI